MQAAAKSHAQHRKKVRHSRYLENDTSGAKKNKAGKQSHRCRLQMRGKKSSKSAARGCLEGRGSSWNADLNWGAKQVKSQLNKSQTAKQLDGRIQLWLHPEGGRKRGRGGEEGAQQPGEEMCLPGSPGSIIPSTNMTESDWLTSYTHLEICLIKQRP